MVQTVEIEFVGIEFEVVMVMGVLHSAAVHIAAAVADYYYIDYHIFRAAAAVDIAEDYIHPAAVENDNLHNIHHPYSHNNYRQSSYHQSELILDRLAVYSLMFVIAFMLGYYLVKSFFIKEKVST